MKRELNLGARRGLIPAIYYRQIVYRPRRDGTRPIQESLLIRRHALKKMSKN
jgi:hypothetical protein